MVEKMEVFDFQVLDNYLQILKISHERFLGGKFLNLSVDR